jgi:hypothetical protein
VTEKPIGPQWTQGAQPGQRDQLGQSCPGNPAQPASGHRSPIQNHSGANLATPPAPQAKAHEPEHLYDTAPSPTGKAFLLCVMHDPTTPIAIRITAANTLLRIFGADAFYPPRLTYRVPGFTLQ